MQSIILDEVLQKLNSSPTVSDAFQNASRGVSNAVGPQVTDKWAQGGAELYNGVSSSWEATLEYFKASPVLAEVLGPDSFLKWSGFGIDIGKESALVAISFFRASPSMASVLDGNSLEKWVTLGRSIYKHPGVPEVLACRFFEMSHRLTRDSAFRDPDLLVKILTSVSKTSNDLAVDILSLSSRLFQTLDDTALLPFLNTALALSENNVFCVRSLFDVGLTTYTTMEPNYRSELLSAVNSVASNTSHDNLVAYLGHVSKFHDSFKGEGGPLVSRFSGLLAESCIPASREFMKNIPEILERLDLSMVELWCQHGVDLLAAYEAAGVNFFRFESKESIELLYTLTPAVDLQEVRDILRLYCQALMGKNIVILPAEEISETGPGWAIVEKTPYGGAAIFAPSRMQEFDSKELNFESYKVLATHQAGHLEFTTYDFSFSKEGTIFPSLRGTLEQELKHERNYLADFERFFSLFPSRRLARDLFSVAEDARIDYKVKQEYRGIRRALTKAQDQALLQRPPLESLNVKEAMVEILLQITLGVPGPFYIHEDYVPVLTKASGIVSAMASEEATVEDAVEATLRLYHLIHGLPDTYYNEIPPDRTTAFSPNGDGYDSEDDDMENMLASMSGLKGIEPEDLGQNGETQEYRGIPGMPHRGDIYPEAIQSLSRLQKDLQQNMKQLQDGSSPEVTQDMIQKLLDSLIENYDLEDNWEEQGQSEVLSGDALIAALIRMLKGQEDVGESALAAALGENDMQVFQYDEWDYRARTYRSNWCKIKQRTLKEGGSGFYEETLYTYQWLVSAIRRQFEMLRPENFRRVKRLPDGDEFDLDAVIEAAVDRKAGFGSSDKLYWRRAKSDRDVAVAVLLDMSLSTDERVEQKRTTITTAEPYEIEREKDFSKRIIDVERESLVLLIEALEQIKDLYGVYGFSGAGKEDVQFYVIKEMNEPFSQQIKSRIDKITPVQGTRMGAALRHTISKLEQTDAKTKVLILISDGRPQDRDYGSSSWEIELAVANFSRFSEYYGSTPQDMFVMDEKEYAVHDTKMALTEARNKNIIPFCISIDKEGHDYMREMCGDIGYEVVGDIESLPRRLPSLYRRLTT